MEKYKILGISGSPRRNHNTDHLLEIALEAAREIGDVETEFISLAEHPLNFCTGCMECFGWKKGSSNGVFCYVHNDDGNWINQKVLECDGLILAAPVYAYDISGLMKAFLERANFSYMAFTEYSGALRFKPLGAITVGVGDIEAQESAGHTIWRWGLALSLIPVSAPPTGDDTIPVASLMGCFASTVDARWVYEADAFSKEKQRTNPPTQGSRNIRAARNLGKNVAIVAKIVKTGLKTLKEQGINIPETFPFKKYSGTPIPGSYIERLVKEGKVELVKY